MDTPRTSTYGSSATDFDRDDLSQYLKSSMATPMLTFNDPPWPGSVYVISYGDTSQVMTYQDGKVILADYEGKSTQRWVCHSQDGWLGFTNDPGESTLHMGFDRGDEQKLICRARHPQWDEMFCVRKRPETGFRMLMKSGGDSHLLWPLARNSDGRLGVIRGSDDWWGFTKTS
ncbi:hypothetical protein TWF281_005695 [Arthrobotrys megalospora]